MAKIKLTGHASGTGVLTVTAPNTSTDRTITLPDATDTLIGAATTDALTTRINGASGRKNMIINGAMRVAQRGTSSTTEGFSTVDRFRTQADGEDQLVITQSQSTTAPDGFRNSFKLQSTTAETAWAADETAHFKYYTEAQDMQHLKYGTSDAQSITLSFWVRSEVTGTYAVQIYAQDGDRCIGSTYAISSADTWEQKTMTFAGDTGGTINDDNGRGLQIGWYLGAGTDAKSTDNTSWGADVTAKQAYGHTADWGTATSHDYHITGVQLEVGSTATDFEHRSYGEELALCKRYYQYYYGNSAMHPGRTISSNRLDVAYHFPVGMRDDPTLEAYDIGQVYTSGQSAFNPSSPSVAAVHISPNGLVIRRTCSETIVANAVLNGQILYLRISAEL